VRTIGKKMPLLSAKRARRRTQGPPVSLTLIHEKVMEQLVLETICRHMKDKKVIGSSQHVFTKWKSCLTNLITFCDETTGWVVEGIAVDMVCLNLSKAFDTVFHKIFIEKLLKCGLDEETVRWIEKSESLG